MDGISLFDRVIDFDVVEKAVEHTVNLFDILSDDSVKIVSEFSIIKLIPQELGKGFNRDQGIFDPVDKLDEKDRGVREIQPAGMALGRFMLRRFSRLRSCLFDKGEK